MRNALLVVLALSLTSCVAVVKAPPDNNPPPQQPHRNNPPPQKPPPVVDSSLQMKYDTALDDCFEASRKVMGIMKMTEVQQNKKNGIIEGQWGKVFGRCSMYRRNHHTYVTFYFSMPAGSDARLPVDFCKNAHTSLGLQIKEEGRKSD